MTTSLAPSSQPHSLSVNPGPGFIPTRGSAIGAALVAMTALMTSGRCWEQAPLGVMLLASSLLPFRYRGTSWIPWVVRFVLYGAILDISLEQAQTIAAGAQQAAGFLAVGRLCGAEIVVQSWRRKAIGPPGAVIVLLSSIVFVAAADAPSAGLIPILSPLYATLLVLHLRGFRERGSDPRSLKSTGIALLVAICIGAAGGLTVSATRPQLIEWSINLMANQFPMETVGLSPTPDIGRTFGLSGSPRRVLLIDGSVEPRWLRASAFDSYHLGAWRPALENRPFQDAPASILNPARTRRTAGSSVRVTRLIDYHQIVYAPLDAATIQLPSLAAPRWSPESGGPLESGGESDKASDNVFVYHFTAPIHPNFQGPLCRPLNARERQRLLVVPPEVDRQALALVDPIAAGLRRPLDRAQAVQHFLITHYRYVLDAGPWKGDPVSWFLLRKREGHCQFFASAAVILLRHLGIPARYVDGYYAHEARGDNAMVVRQRDAHAWAECWIDGTGWITLDATPPSGYPDRLYGPVSRWRLLEEKLRDFISRIQSHQFHLDRKAIAEFIGAGVVLFMVIRLLIDARSRSRMRRSDPFGYSSYDQELARLGTQFEAFLDRIGHPCPPQFTWREHLVHLDETHPIRATLSRAIMLDRNEALRFVTAYNGLRFGGSSDPESLAGLKLQLNALVNTTSGTSSNGASNTPLLRPANNSSNRPSETLLRLPSASLSDVPSTTPLEEDHDA